jgi:hypothetical protein
MRALVIGLAADLQRTKFTAMDVEADLVFVYREAPFFTGSTSIGL